MYILTNIIINMQKILNKITSIIKTYESGVWVSSETLRIMSRELSCNMYYLTKHNIEAFKDWNKIVYNFKGSNAAGETLAHNKVPELRMTRKILESARGVSISMNNELGIIKKE